MRKGYKDTTPPTFELQVTYNMGRLWCRECNEYKDTCDFHKNKNNKANFGHNHYCKSCWAKRRDTAKYRKSQQQAAESKKINIIKMLGNKCQKCGNVNHESLVFHYVRNKPDKFTSLYLFSEDKAMKEAANCVLLCRSCKISIESDLTGVLLSRGDRLGWTYERTPQPDIVIPNIDLSIIEESIKDDFIRTQYTSLGTNFSIQKVPYNNNTVVVLYRSSNANKRQAYCVVLGIESKTTKPISIAKLDIILSSFHNDNKRIFSAKLNSNMHLYTVKVRGFTYIGIHFNDNRVKLIAEVVPHRFLQDPESEVTQLTSYTTCKSKIAYISLYAAMGASAQIAEKFKSNWMRPYQCNVCNDWHLTNQAYKGEKK